MPNGKGLYGRARGSVRTLLRVGTYFAEGQYVLRRGSVRTFSRVPTAFPTAFLNEQPYHRSHCLCVNMTFSAKGIRSLIMPYHEVPESQKCSAYSRYLHNLGLDHSFQAVSVKYHFYRIGAMPRGDGIATDICISRAVLI